MKSRSNSLSLEPTLEVACPLACSYISSEVMVVVLKQLLFWAFFPFSGCSKNRHSFRIGGGKANATTSSAHCVFVVG